MQKRTYWRMVGRMVGLMLAMVGWAAPTAAQNVPGLNVGGTGTVSAQSAGAVPYVATDGRSLGFTLCGGAGQFLRSGSPAVSCLDLFSANNTWTGSNTWTGLPVIQGSFPRMFWYEDDQTGAEGRYRLMGANNHFRLDKNTAAAGDFSTVTSYLDLNGETGVLDLSPSGAAVTIAGNRVRDRASDPIVFKASDTARTNTTTLTADPHLSLSLPTGSSFFQILVVVTQVNAAVDFKYTFNGSLSSCGTIVWADSKGNTVTGGVGTSTSLDLGGVDSVLITGSVPSCANAGTLQFWWAPNTSSANAVTVKAGSVLWGKNN